MRRTPGAPFPAGSPRRPTAPCPCGLGLPYAECCGRYHAGAPAPTAETLMRSRYTAFVVGDWAYVARTWAEETRPSNLAVAPGGEPFTRLEIVETVAGGPFANEGVVEFAAHYPGGVQRERSRFARRGGHWVYVDGMTTSRFPFRDDSGVI